MNKFVVEFYRANIESHISVIPALKRLPSWMPDWVLRRLMQIHDWTKKYDNRIRNETFEVTRTRLDFSNIVDHVNIQKDTVYRQTGRIPSQLFIGYSSYMEISNEIMIEYNCFNNLEFQNLFGLKIIVVPWIDGLLVMP